ncbi:MAG: hypothetical protein H0W25_13515 [Acidimicrobiia bacterium]|nr:hypothetical protein [Acidimicrobiia bacterium]
MLEHPDLDQRFVAAPQASLNRPAFRVAWPGGGLPVALDLAASAMLDCFDEPLSPRHLADDLVAALGLEPAVALESASSVAQTLLRSGHVIPDGMVPMPPDSLAYPPPASP